MQACRDLASSPIASLSLRKRRRRRGSDEEGYLTGDSGTDSEPDTLPGGSDEEEDGLDESALGELGGFPDGRYEDMDLPPSLLSTGVPTWRVYQPRIYGFRVSELAKSGPRMRWMRARPYSYAQLMGRKALAESARQPSRVGLAPPSLSKMEEQGTESLASAALGQEKGASDTRQVLQSVEAEPPTPPLAAPAVSLDS